MSHRMRRATLGLVTISIVGLGSTACVDRLIVVERDSGAFGDSDGADDDEFPEDDEASDADESRPPSGPAPECDVPSDCEAEESCFEGTCVGAGEFRVSLSWDFVSDLDLHVKTPDGIEVWFERPEGGGGQLDVDDCVGGSCASVQGPHVENIFFNSAAVRGTYQVWVHNYDGRRSGRFRIEVAGEANATFEDRIAAADVTSVAYSFTY